MTKILQIDLKYLVLAICFYVCTENLYKLEVYMKVNNSNTRKDWTYYLSMIHASSDPLDFLFGTNEIPYKKYNRNKITEKNMLRKKIKREQTISN